MMRLGILIVLGLLWAMPLWAAPVYPPAVAWSGTVSQPPLARPAYRQTVVDPAFGSNITRMSGDEMNPSDPVYIQHNYSKDQPWNADMTFIKLSGAVFILDAKTYKVFKKQGFHNEALWSTVDPSILYYVQGNQFRKLNVRTNVDVAIHSFAEGTLQPDSRIQ